MYVIKFADNFYFGQYANFPATQSKALRFDDAQRVGMTDLAAKLGGRWIRPVPKMATIGRDTTF